QLKPILFPYTTLFRSLADIAPRRPEEQVLRGLHGDRAGAAERPALKVLRKGALDRVPIEAVMLAEARILRRHDRADKIRRNLIVDRKSTRLNSSHVKI